MIKIGLNGYGRIGRNVHRILLDHPDIEVVAINARSEDNVMRAHLLKYDSLHGKIPNDIKPGEDKIVVDGKDVKCFSIKDASEIPWSDVGVDIVLEAAHGQHGDDFSGVLLGILRVPVVEGDPHLLDTDVIEQT